MNEILRSISHIRATGLFLKNLADIFLLITFVELANGFLLCLKGPGEPSRVRKFGRWAILAWGFVLFAISLGLFGASTSFYVRAYGDFPTDSDDYVSDLLNEQMNLNRLLGALKILLWISTMPTVVLASLVMHKTKHHNILRSVRPPSPRPMHPP